MSATLTRRRGRPPMVPGNPERESGPMVFKGISNLVPLADLTLHTDPLTIRNDQRADIVRECERGWTVQRIADTVILPDRLVVRHLKAIRWPIRNEPRKKVAPTSKTGAKPTPVTLPTNQCRIRIVDYLTESQSGTVSEIRAGIKMSTQFVRMILERHPELFRVVEIIPADHPTPATKVWGLVGGAK